MKPTGMQDFFTQARKNGIILHTEGPCQLCGAEVQGGIFQCHENVHYLSKVLDFTDPAYFRTRFLSVDAMALQHSEVHGPWNNHLHLTRLYLILNLKVSWDYGKTPQLSQVINQYKKRKTEQLEPPPQKQRGTVTTLDLLKASSPKGAVAVVQRWAEEVLGSFSRHHEPVAFLAARFLDKYNT
jgi:hypothetical protein